MIDFRLTKKALEDLRSIGRYTEKKWGRDQRNKYLAKLDDSFNTIVREPHIGPACDYIRCTFTAPPLKGALKDFMHFIR